PPMICQRCGNDIPEKSSICPNCGSATSRAKPSSQHTSYGQFPQHEIGARPSNQHGSTHFTPPSNTETPQPSPRQAGPGPRPVHGVPLYYQAQANYTPF